MTSTTVGATYPAGVRVTDANGSPVTSGLTATYTITKPDGTVSAPASATHLGGGVWGANQAGTVTATPGTYIVALTISTGLTPLPGVLYETFTVGYPLPGQRTLRDIVVAIYRRLGDGHTGTSTGAGSTTTLVDAAVAVGKNNDWLSSQLILLEPMGVGDAEPRWVRGFAASTGTFTVPPASAFTATVASGTDYLVCNLWGKGYRYEHVLGLIADVIDRAGASVMVSNQVALTTTGGGRYALPVEWDSLARVYVADGTDTTQLSWRRVAPNQLEVLPDSRTFRLLGWQPATGYPVRIEGRVRVGIPASLGGLVELDGQAVVRAAVAELALGSPHESHVRLGTLLGPSAERGLAATARGRGRLR